MFDFAISQNQARPPSRLFWASLVISVIAHAATLEVLLVHPWILGQGLSHWLRNIEAAMRTTPKDTPRKDEDGRLVALVGDPTKMQAPSGEVLRGLMYDWNGARNSSKQAIRVRWGAEDATVSETATKAAKPVPAPQRPPPVPLRSEAAAEPSSPGGAATPAGGTGTEAGTGATVTIPLPAPNVETRRTPARAAETPANTAPTSVPIPLKPETPSQAAVRTPASTPPTKPPAQVFENEKQALRTEGSGLFDTKGFPLGEYANTVIERVKGNWYIPSNLRNSQGRTTVVFFIGKDGRSVDARIVASSGSQSLDLAALNAVIVSNPFPPLPRGFPGDQVGAKFVFSYNEHQ